MTKKKVIFFSGEFSCTEQWFNGWPVYKNKQGRLLHFDNGGGWSIGAKIGVCGIRGPKAQKCPSKIKEWYYVEGTKYLKANITVNVSFSTKM